MELFLVPLNAVLVSWRSVSGKELHRILRLHKEQLEAAGYTNVSALRKDEQGIWRGTAMKDGRQVSVGIDFKGNIAAS